MTRTTKKTLWTAWALAPLAMFAWSVGPGQAYFARTAASDRLAEARRAVETRDWVNAAGAFADSLALLPAGDPNRARLELEHAAARVRAGEVLEGVEQLETLLADPATKLSESFETAVRHELATAHYFAGWLMRLEGAAPEEWREETGRARQHWRLLSEGAQRGDRSAVQLQGQALGFAQNLEAVIRLEEMDLSTLQGLPLPKDCPGNCDNLSQRKREQRLSRCNNKGRNPSDARQQIQSDGASAARRQGSGS